LPEADLFESCAAIGEGVTGSEQKVDFIELSSDKGFLILGVSEASLWNDMAPIKHLAFSLSVKSGMCQPTRDCNGRHLTVLPGGELVHALHLVVEITS